MRWGGWNGGGGEIIDGRYRAMCLRQCLTDASRHCDSRTEAHWRCSASGWLGRSTVSVCRWTFLRDFINHTHSESWLMRRKKVPDCFFSVGSAWRSFPTHTVLELWGQLLALVTPRGRILTFLHQLVRLGLYLALLSRRRILFFFTSPSSVYFGLFPNPSNKFNGWEFISETVLKSSRLKCSFTEPIREKGWADFRKLNDDGTSMLQCLFQCLPSHQHLRMRARATNFTSEFSLLRGFSPLTDGNSCAVSQRIQSSCSNVIEWSSSVNLPTATLSATQSGLWGTVGIDASRFF